MLGVKVSLLITWTRCPLGYYNFLPVFLWFQKQFFSRYPLRGQLYEAFKNTTRLLPDALKLRRSTRNKKRIAAEAELDDDTGIDEVCGKKGTLHIC